MVRHLKLARDSAVKARAQAMQMLKALIVSAPAELREQLEGGLRAISRRWLSLSEEIEAHDRDLDALAAAHTPELITAPGIATGTAAEMLILVGDNPERIRSEAAFAKMCGTCPLPASSGKTSRHRLNRGGNRQANAATGSSLLGCAATVRHQRL